MISLVQLEVGRPRYRFTIPPPKHLFRSLLKMHRLVTLCPFAVAEKLIGLLSNKSTRRDLLSIDHVYLTYDMVRKMNVEKKKQKLSNLLP